LLSFGCHFSLKRPGIETGLISWHMLVYFYVHPQDGSQGGNMETLSARTVLRIMPLFFLCALLGSCGIFSQPDDEQREEIVAGVLMPIPRGMNKSTERRVELTLPGIEGGTVTYQGSVEPKEIISFYQIEMPRRGWTPKGSLVSQGGALAFTKANRSALIRVSRSGATILDILVGNVPLQTPSPLQEKTTEVPK
jgi:hypothetical protein